MRFRRAAPPPISTAMSLVVSVDSQSTALSQALGLNDNKLFWATVPLKQLIWGLGLKRKKPNIDLIVQSHPQHRPGGQRMGLEGAQVGAEIPGGGKSLTNWLEFGAPCNSPKKLKW